MGYVTPEFYKGEYHGNSIPDDLLQSMLERASRDIDMLTRMKIHKFGGFSQLSEFEQKQVQIATCCQADYLHLKASLDGVSSYNIGDVSVSYGETVDKYDKDCVAYLNATRLTYRGL